MLRFLKVSQCVRQRLFGTLLNAHCAAECHRIVFDEFFVLAVGRGHGELIAVCLELPVCLPLELLVRLRFELLVHVCLWPSYQY